MNTFVVCPLLSKFMYVQEQLNCKTTLPAMMRSYISSFSQLQTASSSLYSAHVLHVPYQCLSRQRDLGGSVTGRCLDSEGVGMGGGGVIS